MIFLIFEFHSRLQYHTIMLTFQVSLFTLSTRDESNILLHARGARPSDPSRCVQRFADTFEYEIRLNSSFSNPTNLYCPNDNDAVNQFKNWKTEGQLVINIKNKPCTLRYQMLTITDDVLFLIPLEPYSIDRKILGELIAVVL